jgi:hypothetical protein
MCPNCETDGIWVYTKKSYKNLISVCAGQIVLQLFTGKEEIAICYHQYLQFFFQTFTAMER